MQDERHGKLGAKAKVEQEKNAAQTHKAVSAALLDADSESVFPPFGLCPGCQFRSAFRAFRFSEDGSSVISRKCGVPSLSSG